MADRSIPTKRLKDDCALYEREMRSAQGTLPAALSSFRPGERDNPDVGASGWYVYLTQLLLARGLRAEESPAPSVKTIADVAGTETLSGTPLVQLSRVQGDGAEPRYLTVYPKSFVVLTHLHGRDMALARLQPTVGGLFERPDFRPDVLRRVMDAIAEEHLLCAWIATHPGVWMPWEPEQPPPPIPAEIRAIHPLELHQILEMNLAVNYRRLVTARPLLTPDPTPAETQLYWSPFFAKAGEMLGHSTRVLMRDWSLESVLLSLQLLGSAQRDAQAKAERDRDGA